MRGHNMLGLVIVAVGLFGVAIGQTCQCCVQIMGWGDGSTEGSADPCAPGTVTVCEQGSHSATAPAGRCANGARVRLCLVYSPAGSTNIITAACDSEPSGFHRIGPSLGFGTPEQCCFVDDATFTAGEEIPRPDLAGVIDCTYGEGC